MEVNMEQTDELVSAVMTFDCLNCGPVTHEQVQYLRDAVTTTAYEIVDVESDGHMLYFNAAEPELVEDELTNEDFCCKNCGRSVVVTSTEFWEVDEVE